MFLLTDLTETGYLQIKKDRALLVDKIQGLQTLVEEIDLALPFLESIYEPNVKISRDEKSGFFFARATVPANTKGGEKLLIKVMIGKITDYNYGEKDPQLIERANNAVKQHIRNSFPLHFK